MIPVFNLCYIFCIYLKPMNYIVLGNIQYNTSMLWLSWSVSYEAVWLVVNGWKDTGTEIFVACNAVFSIRNWLTLVLASMSLSPLWMTGRPSTESDREDSGKWNSIQRREQSEFYVPPYPSAPRRRWEEMIYTNSVFYKVHVLCYLGTGN